MGNTLLSVIGSLVVFFLGLLLYMVKSTRSDIEKLETHVDNSLEKTKDEIMARVQKPDCVREMKDIREDIKTIISDVKVIERSQR